MSLNYAFDSRSSPYRKTAIHIKNDPEIRVSHTHFTHNMHFICVYFLGKWIFNLSNSRSIIEWKIIVMDEFRIWHFRFSQTSQISSDFNFAGLAFPMVWGYEKPFLNLKIVLVVYSLSRQFVKWELMVNEFVTIFGYCHHGGSNLCLISLFVRKRYPAFSQACAFSFCFSIHGTIMQMSLYHPH